MCRVIQTALLVILVFFGAASPAAVGTDKARAADTNERLDCYVSILPQAFLVERVGGNRVAVGVMVGPGQVPHTYEPTGRQLAELAKSRVFFSVGVAFEQSLIPRIKRSFGSVKIVDSCAGIEKRLMLEDGGHEKAGTSGHAGAASGGPSGEAHRHGDYDPHVWLSPRMGAAMARNIRDALVALDPGGADSYAANCQALESELDSVDFEISRLLRPYKGRELFVFHPAYGYFTDAYGLAQVAIEKNGAAPGPKHLAEVIDRARVQGARTIFVQPQVSATFAETVAKAIGGKVVSLDPLSEDYTENLLIMARRIAESFDSEGE